MNNGLAYYVTRVSEPNKFLVLTEIYIGVSVQARIIGHIHN